ncbi:hypothetical protein [Vibrio navarrensis]|uniref:hypothetical protein n=1 Tax=Vibrio navarrensis TaxID=29495 RepID=UPI0018DCDCF0|nr:hypothetical protein [Vibrio navarrensis]MBH9740009.1 hypothetical protein [Vibrio navarrensis]
MADIFIDLDSRVYAPVLEMTLSEMIKKGDFSWPTGATCATQECDGEIIWWRAPVSEVTEARKGSGEEKELVSILGWDAQIEGDYFSVDDQEYVSADWKTAVVTFEQFVGLI